MERFSGGTAIESMLGELRPAPNPDFTAELDAWAAAGCPPRSRGERRASAVARTSRVSLHSTSLWVPAAASAGSAGEPKLRFRRLSSSRAALRAIPKSQARPLPRFGSKRPRFR